MQETVLPDLEDCSRMGQASRTETLMAHRRSVERAISTIRERLEEDLSLGDMAAMGYMSPFHFNRVFHSVTGIPPGQFLSALRIHLAKRFLLTTEERVTEICFAVGYNSLGTFTRRFNELVGLPPGRFRAFGRSAVTDVLSRVEGIVPPPVDPMALRPGNTGKVETSAPHRSQVLIGVFAEALAQGRPLACTIALSPGAYRLPLLPDGRYEILAVSLPDLEDPFESLLFEKVLRAWRPVRFEGGRATGPIDLALHPPREIDPPILSALPWLLAQHMVRQPELFMARSHESP